MSQHEAGRRHHRLGPVASTAAASSTTCTPYRSIEPPLEPPADRDIWSSYLPSISSQLAQSPVLACGYKDKVDCTTSGATGATQSPADAEHFVRIRVSSETEKDQPLPVVYKFDLTDRQTNGIESIARDSLTIEIRRCPRPVTSSQEARYKQSELPLPTKGPVSKLPSSNSNHVNLLAEKVESSPKETPQRSVSWSDPANRSLTEGANLAHLPSTTTTWTPTLIYGRPSTCTEYFALGPERKGVRVFHPIQRPDLPHDFSYATAKRLYRKLKSCHDDDVKSWMQQSGDEAFVERFELRQRSLSALQIWMWTHPHLSLSEEKKSEKAGVKKGKKSCLKKARQNEMVWPTEGIEEETAWQDLGVEMPCDEYGEFAVVDGLPGHSRYQDQAAGQSAGAKIPTVDVKGRKASSQPVYNFEEQWDAALVEGQVPYQLGDGPPSPAGTNFKFA